MVFSLLRHVHVTDAGCVAMTKANGHGNVGNCQYRQRKPITQDHETNLVSAQKVADSEIEKE